MSDRMWTAIRVIVLSGGVWVGLSTIALAGPVDHTTIEVSGDFNGDGLMDTARGFPDANSGVGRVDIHWGQAGYIPTNPTVLSPLLYPKLRPGRFGAALAVGDFNNLDGDDLAIGVPDGQLGSQPAGAGAVHIMHGCATTCGSIDGTGAGVDASLSALNPVNAIATIGGVSTSSNDLPNLGASLAVGDFNADSYDDLAYGAPNDTRSGRFQAGMVFVRYGSSSGIVAPSVALHHQNMGSGFYLESRDHFGASLAVANLDDAYGDDLIVGVPDEDWASHTDAGEVDILWSGPTGLSPTNNLRRRVPNGWTGGGQSQDHFGREVAGAALLFVASVDEATVCGGSAARLIYSAETHDIASVMCEPDVCDGPSDFGSGMLPVIPLHIVELVPPDAFFGNLIPSAWNGVHPITGDAASGFDDYSEGLIDLLNQQTMREGGRSVCFERDCLQFQLDQTTSFAAFPTAACPDLARVFDPNDVVTTSNCGDQNDDNAITGLEWACPSLDGVVQPSLGSFMRRAANKCMDAGGLPSESLPLFIYDECARKAGPDGVMLTTDDRRACVSLGGISVANGYGRSGLETDNSVRHTGDYLEAPIAFVDYVRAVQPRVAGSVSPQAAEEHEIGHALGLHHRVMCPVSSGASTPTMYSGKFVSSNGIDSFGNQWTEVGGVWQPPAGVPDCATNTGFRRELGFSSGGGWDAYDNVWMEGLELVRTARKHHTDLWSCP